MKTATINSGLIALALLLSCLMPGNYALAQDSKAQNQIGDNIARIGVLAFRGKDAARLRWLPLIDYFTKAIEGWRFEFVPVTLGSAPRQIETRKIDFLITNPGHYVELQDRYHLSTLATRERRIEAAGSGILEFGTAIITRKDSNIHSLGDIRNKSIAAVSPDAFGGFLLAWHEFQRQNIDPFKDLKTLQFMGFPQDAIIAAVAAGRVDVGIVRSGLLELLASEGKVDLTSFRVLQSNNQIDYPHMISSRLYPEWPFAALPATNKQLREAVLVALIATQQPKVAREHGLKDLWSAPLSYREVRKLIATYKNHNKTTPADNISGNQLWSSILLIALLALALFTAYLQIARYRQRPGFAGQKPTGNAAGEPGAAKVLARFSSLTKREREILCMICSGLSSKVIADELGISAKTVEYHRANLLQKTKAGTTPQLVQLATRLGFDESKLFTYK